MTRFTMGLCVLMMVLGRGLSDIYMVITGAACLISVAILTKKEPLNDK